MKIIFNSDVLWSLAKARSDVHVPSWFVEFAATAREKGFEIVIPETAYLELERAQQQRTDLAQGSLRTAYEELRKHGIHHDEPDPESVMKVPDLVSMLSDLGISIVKPSPTLADFNDAHKRACFRLSPHTSLTDHQSGHREASDEMRDLLIWAMAVRFAQEEGGAVLVSRDGVHTGPAGNEEALSVGLMRVKDVSGALQAAGALDAAGPGVAFVALLMDASWKPLSEAGLPLATKPRWSELKVVSLVQGEKGPAEVNAAVGLDGETGSTIKANAKFSISDGLLKKVRLQDISIADEPSSPPTLTVDDIGVAIPQSQPESEAQLKALRGIIGLRKEGS